MLKEVLLSVVISSCVAPGPENGSIPPRSIPLTGTATPPRFATLDAQIATLDAHAATFEARFRGQVATIDARLSDWESGLVVELTRDAIQDATIDASLNNYPELEAAMATLPQPVVDSAIAIFSIDDRGYYTSQGSGTLVRSQQTDNKIGFSTTFHTTWARDTNAQEKRFEIFAPQKRARPLVIDGFDVFVDSSFTIDPVSGVATPDYALVVPHDQVTLKTFMTDANMQPLEMTPVESPPSLATCYALTFSSRSQSVAYIPRVGTLTDSQEGWLFSSPRGDGLMGRGPSALA